MCIGNIQHSSIRVFTPKGTDISAKWNGDIHGGRIKSGLALNAAGTLLAVEYIDQTARWHTSRHINVFQTGDQALHMGFDSGVSHTRAMVFGNNNDLYIIQEIDEQVNIHIWDVGGDALIPRPMETITVFSPDDDIRWYYCKFIFDLDTSQRNLVFHNHMDDEMWYESQSGQRYVKASDNACLYNLDTKTLTKKWPGFPKPVLDIVAKFIDLLF